MHAFGMTMTQIDAAGAHWTAREILQQPQIWAQVEHSLAGESARLATFLEPLLKRPELRLVLTGAGTSAHARVRWLRSTASRMVSCRRPSTNCGYSDTSPAPIEA